MSSFSRKVLLWHLVLGLLLGACNGTDGTLVVLHDGGGAGGSSGSPAAAENPYVPRPDVRWLVQLDGAVDITESADLFYLDAELQDPADLAALHAQGRRYLCYLSAGSLESFRDDADEFPDTAVGNPLADFPRERWLDVRDPTVRELMARRVTALSELGCDGIPPSSLAVHNADTGFELSATDALDYARWLAERVHAAGMSAGLSGPSELTSELWPSFDFGLGIGCLDRTGCREYEPFGQAKKPVLHIELGDQASAPEICNAAKALGFSPLISDQAFSGRCIACSDLL
ncbi:MAG TPA: endo alpha-1,4 polygalactosaminidase [Polyangiaceae bacterium]|nr:endo alpha-1,4 polygalactosaminidase [Polyangiaceae bacterium]